MKIYYSTCSLIFCIFSISSELVQSCVISLFSSILTLSFIVYKIFSFLSFSWYSSFMPMVKSFSISLRVLLSISYLLWQAKIIFSINSRLKLFRTVSTCFKFIEPIAITFFFVGDSPMIYRVILLKSTRVCS